MPDADWLTWPQAAALVGCPVPTIDWHTRTGRITTRPHQGPRPTVSRASIEDFSRWWAADQERRAARRAASVPQGDRPPEPTGWITAPDAAALLGRSAHTVTRYLINGRLRGVRLGRRWWIEEASVLALVESRSTWVSFVGAASLAGCSIGVIEDAVRAGQIRKRVLEHRAAPSLDRASVLWFAAAHRDHLAQTAAAAAEKAARTRAATCPPDDTHEWITRAQAAHELGISAVRVRQLAAAERLPCTRVGSRWWFRRDHIDIVKHARQARQTRHIEPSSH